MANMISNSSESSGKKWYQKPENLTSGAFLIILGVIGMKYGASLLQGALNLAGFAITAGILALFASFIISQWRMLTTVWQVSMYKLTNWVYRIDPIAVAWSRLDSLKEKRDKINKSVEKIKGALYNVTRQVNSNITEIETKKTQIRAINNIGGKELQLKLLAGDCARIEQWNTELIPLQQTMENMQNGLKKLYEAANFIIQDKESELTLLEKRYNSVKIGWAAVKEAQGIYGKNSKDRQELEEMIDFAGQDMDNKLAEMDRFMELAAPVFTQVDIENSVNDIKVKEMIERVTKGDLDKVLENMTSPTPIKKSDNKKLGSASASKNQIPSNVEGPEKLAATQSATSDSEKQKYDVLN